MANAKKEHDYDVTINFLANLNGALFGGFNPYTANPIRNHRTEELKSQRDPRGKEGFALLAAGLSKISEGVLRNG